MSDRNVRLGIVGLGMWGTMHVKAYRQHGDAELVGVCDLDRQKLREVADRYDIGLATTDLDELLAADLDGISVVTPDHAHTEVVLSALGAGCHVLVEKPLALSVDECRQMIDRAGQAERHLMVDWHNRWNIPFVRARRLVDRGELGDVRYIYHRLSDTIEVPTRMLHWAGGSSVLNFLGSHCFDTLCWLIDDEPVRIFCKKTEGVLSSRGIDTADVYVTMIDFAGGATAVVENGWIYPEEAPSLVDHRCTITGTRGMVELDLTHHRALTRWSPEACTEGEYPFADVFVLPTVHGKQVGFAVESIYHFVDCLRDGTAPLTDGEDGLRVTKMLLAAERSAEVGRWVDID